jgi:mannose-6-phosphate isomerase-like protein (cupin superfamily)
MQPVSKNIDKADETRQFPNGHLDVVQVGDVTFGRATFEPGWKWSESVKPVAGTDLCMVHHNGYVVSGNLHIVMEDGTEVDVGPGDVFVCPPGHDAWVLGDEACVALDFAAGIATYAT